MRLWVRSTFRSPWRRTDVGTVRASASVNLVTFYNPHQRLPQQEYTSRSRSRSYYVELQKPLQVQFFVDPESSQVVVHRIFAGCTRTECRLLQPGDTLLSAGPVDSRHGKWSSDELSALLPALMDDSSLQCIMERPPRSPGSREGYIWYALGAAGETCSEAVAMGALADHSVLVVPQQGEPRRPGRQLLTSFHRIRQGEAQFLRRLARPEQWRRNVNVCRAVPPLELRFPPPAQDAAQPYNGAPRGGHTPPLAARAVLPWLVIVQGMLDAEGAVAVAAELGLQTVDVVRVAMGPGGWPRLRGSPLHVSPLSAFIGVVCGVHAAAVRLGVTGRGIMRNGGRTAVLVHAPHQAPGYAATVMAAVLHWVGCLPLAESAAVAGERCASEVDVGLIRAATAKLAREAAFRPRPLRVTWPYGGDGSVVLAIDAAGKPRREAPCTASRGLVPLPDSRQRYYTPGPADAQAATRHVVINPGAGDGPIEIPMHCSKQGAHTAEVWVHPKHTATTLRYAFRVQSIRSVDPALPLSWGVGGQMMHTLAVPAARVLRTEEVAAARREAARSVRMLRRSSFL
eukprot:jgi/Ulvmu1/7684/UM038_0116.1